MILKRKLNSSWASPQGTIVDQGQEAIKLNLRLSEKVEYSFLIEKCDQQDFQEIGDYLEEIAEQLSQNINDFARQIKQGVLPIPLLSAGCEKAYLSIRNGKIFVNERSTLDPRSNNKIIMKEFAKQFTKAVELNPKEKRDYLEEYKETWS